MRFGVLVGRVIPLFTVAFLFALCLNSVQGAVFYINSTAGTVDDTFWNDIDEYSIYLEYENPYAITCPDLRICYLDDTNSGGVDDDFLINFFLGNDTDYQKFDQYPASGFDLNSKHIAGGNYYLTAVYNNTATGKFAVIVQRGTVWKVYEDLDFVDSQHLSTYFLSSDSATTDKYVFELQKGSIGTNVTTYELSNGDADILLLMIQRDILNVYANQLIINEHYAVNEFGEFSYIQFNGTVPSFKILGTNLTDWSSYGDVYNAGAVSSPYVYDELTSDSYSYHGIQVQYPTSDYFRILYRPQSVNNDVIDGNYRSVALPTCEDIFITNTQTDFYLDSGYWYRKCFGTVPEEGQETCSCELPCIQIGSNYNIASGTCRDLPILDIYDEGSAYCQILEQYDYPYIVPESNYTFTVAEAGVDYVPWRNVNYTSGNLPVRYVVDYVKVNFSGTFNSTQDNLWVNPYIVAGFGHDLGVNDAEFLKEGGSDSCINVDTGEYTTVYATFEPDTVLQCSSYLEGIQCNTETTIFPYTPELGYYSEHSLKYANLYYNPKAYLTYQDCLDDTNSLDSSNLTDKSTVIQYEYAYMSVYGTGGCDIYASSCEPVCDDEDLVYEPDDIVCVGLSCYAVAHSTCNNDGTCDTPYESLSTCPADCTTPTGTEIVDSSADAVKGIVDGGISFISQVLGIDIPVGMAVLWLILTVIVGTGVMLSGGHMMGGVLTYLIMMMMGTMTGWLPIWIGIVFTIIAGVLFAKTLSDFIRGG